MAVLPVPDVPSPKSHAYDEIVPSESAEPDASTASAKLLTEVVNAALGSTFAGVKDSTLRSSTVTSREFVPPPRYDHTPVRPALGKAVEVPVSCQFAGSVDPLAHALTRRVEP